MKRITSLILILVLVLAAAGVVWLRQGKKEEGKTMIPSGSDTVTEQNVPASEKAEEESGEPEYVSDPIYGDELTQEELDAFKEEDSTVDPENPGVTVEEELVIVLDDNQGTGGF